MRLKSIRESGNGCILPETILDTVILIECKYSTSEDDLTKMHKLEPSKLLIKNI